AGSFLRSAAATAAGVVGGQLIFDGLRNLFGGSTGFMPDLGGSFLGNSPIVEENITNIYEPNNPVQDPNSSSGGGDWGDPGGNDNSTTDDGSFGAGGDYDTDDADDNGDYDSDDTF